MNARNSGTGKTVLFYYASLRSYLIYRDLLQNHSHLFSAVIEMPAVPYSRKSGKRNIGLIKKAFTGSLWFPFMSFLTIKVFDWISTIMRKDISSLCKRLGLPHYFWLKIDDALIAFLKEKDPAWIISSTSTLLTREFIEVPHCGVLNVHEGKLPEYKGSACYFWMIYNGEAAGNVTFQYVSVALDEGDVILEGPPVPIEKDTSVFDLWKGLLLSHGSVWPHFLPYLEQGSPAPAARQRRNDFVAYSYPTRTVVRKIKAGGHRIMRFKDLLWILKMGFRG